MCVCVSVQMSSRIHRPSLSAAGSLSSIPMSEWSSLQEPGGQWHPTILLCVPERLQRYSTSMRIFLLWKDLVWPGKSESLHVNWMQLTTSSPGQDCGNIDACATSPCANGARCVNWNNHYNCSCPPGFQGKNCRSDIDECRKPGVCLNGGICTNTQGSFRCQCQPGYSGRTCEVSTLPCAPSQCLNGGTCRQTSDHSYECACLPGRIALY